MREYNLKYARGRIYRSLIENPDFDKYQHAAEADVAISTLHRELGEIRWTDNEPAICQRDGWPRHTYKVAENIEELEEWIDRYHRRDRRQNTDAVCEKFIRTHPDAWKPPTGSPADRPAP